MGTTVGLYEDWRIGGVPRLIYGDPRKALMRIPEEILDSVAFLVTKERHEDDDEKHCRGTAFFVSVRSEMFPNEGYSYLVTAKHNITKALEKDLELYIRLNTHDDKSVDVKVEGGWAFPEDPSVDLAVLPFRIKGPIRYRPLAPTMRADAERLRRLKVGIGDEVVISGLFTRRAGRAKNLPIVRFGNIAAMPDEPLPDSKTGLDFHAYLVEARSFGGLSGSPVFVFFGPERVPPGPVEEEPPPGQCMLVLLGVIRGHWEHEEPLPIETVFADELGKVNWGVATVTPATELEPILCSERFVKQRREADRKSAERDAPVDDFAEDARPFTKDNFESALKKASRKIAPSASDKPEK